MGTNLEDPFFWYIEPGVASVCAIINDSGAGETQFSCQGHIPSEKPADDPEAHDPYVMIGIVDRERCVALIRPLLDIAGDGYHSSVGMEDWPYPHLTVWLHVHEHHDYWDRQNWRKRRAALERARAHLTEVIRQVLAPDAEHVACPGKACACFLEENQAGEEYLYSPVYGCSHDAITDETVISYATGPVCVGRCPHYVRHQGKGADGTALRREV